MWGIGPKTDCSPRGSERRSARRGVRASVSSRTETERTEGLGCRARPWRGRPHMSSAVLARHRQGGARSRAPSPAASESLLSRRVESSRFPPRHVAPGAATFRLRTTPSVAGLPAHRPRAAGPGENPPSRKELLAKRSRRFCRLPVGCSVVGSGPGSALCAYELPPHRRELRFFPITFYPLLAFRRAACGGTMAPIASPSLRAARRRTVRLLRPRSSRQPSPQSVTAASR